MKSNNALRRMAIGLGVFAVLVILPTMFMGMYALEQAAGFTARPNEWWA